MLYAEEQQIQFYSIWVFLLWETQGIVNIYLFSLAFSEISETRLNSQDP
jgi:hypothetical protein